MTAPAGARPAFPPPPAWYSALTALGVTGTNGKTTTTAWLASALGALSSPVVYTSTLGTFLDDAPLDTPRTHRGVLSALERCLKNGGRFAVFEVTSEVLARGFARALPMHVGVFTNLSHDHLDAHGSEEHYLASKAQLFMALPRGGTAVLNAADPVCSLLEEVVPEHARIVRYGVPSRGRLEKPADLEARTVEVSWNGTRITLAPSALVGASLRELSIRAVGEVYAENALAALAGALAAGVSFEGAVARLERTPPLPGRFEIVSRAPWVVVDYAHSPDALERAVATARGLAPARLTVVFGAGGHRDRRKRPLMGAAAAAADRIILTSDNPRDEDPADIARAIAEGIPKGCTVDVELDRAKAIALAITDSTERDVVLVAGRGHETEQMIGNERIPFSDRDVVERVVRGR